MKSIVVRFFIFISLATFWGCAPKYVHEYEYPQYEYPIETEISAPTPAYQPPAYRPPAYGPQPIAYSEKQFSSGKEAPLIVIDAGHGGKDDGAQSKFGNKSLEKNLNLTTAMYVRYYLKQFGFRTALTRSDDTFVPLKKRASWANDIGSTLFVSVHYNSAPSEKAEGIEVYYFKSDENPSRTKESTTLGNNVMDSIINMTGAKSRGVKHANFAVIRETSMPAILVEGGFLSNANDAKNIDNDIYKRKLAWGIATGIKSYLEKK
jgi:N-acetylmuramoyl-L-alanine amidase